MIKYLVSERRNALAQGDTVYQIVIGARVHSRHVKTLPGAHMIAKMHSENDAVGQHVYVYEASDVDHNHMLGLYLNGNTLIKLDD